MGTRQIHSEVKYVSDWEENETNLKTQKVVEVTKNHCK